MDGDRRAQGAITMVHRVSPVIPGDGIGKRGLPESAADCAPFRFDPRSTSGAARSTPGPGA